MAVETNQADAVQLMDSFAARTGLFPPKAEPRRYLWTDAFAVCNYLEIFQRTGEQFYRDLARDLIGQVHWELGRHRRDDPRSGWLSGLDEEEGASHPTAGGLRIGKRGPERGPDDPFDERLEWDRDGQYFHYLTKWMHALAQAAESLDEPAYARWAVELAKAVFPRFVHASRSGEAVGVIWKMSIDLSRPQVRSISPHDALDGYVTFRQLHAGTGAAAKATLDREIDSLGALCRGGYWYTDDPLGLGGLLFDACRLARLPDRGDGDDRLIGELLANAAAGLRDVMRSRQFTQPAAYRLAFRELGLAIGLKALPAIVGALDRAAGLHEPPREPLTALSAEHGTAEDLAAFWLEPESQATAAWTDHRDINEVMLATALGPSQFLGTEDYLS
jgi:hypothetical protein